MVNNITRKEVIFLARPFKYQTKFNNEDPNQIYKEIDFQKFEKCITINDFVNWESLSSEVTVYYLTEEELNEYRKGGE